jgi:hypothetical protein
MSMDLCCSLLLTRLTPCNEPQYITHVEIITTRKDLIWRSKEATGFCNLRRVDKDSRQGRNYTKRTSVPAPLAESRRRSWNQDIHRFVQGCMEYIRACEPVADIAEHKRLDPCGYFDGRWVMGWGPPKAKALSVELRRPKMLRIRAHGRLFRIRPNDLSHKSAPLCGYLPKHFPPIAVRGF